MKALYFNENSKRYEETDISDDASTDTKCTQAFACASCGSAISPLTMRFVSIVLKDFEGNGYQVCRACSSLERKQLEAITENYKLKH